jgi:competence protein ComEC
VMAASVAAGFATATFRTAHIAHEVLVKPAYSVSLSGFCRGAGHSRTDRPFRIARDADGRPATTGKT